MGLDSDVQIMALKAHTLFDTESEWSSLHHNARILISTLSSLALKNNKK